MFVPGPGWFSLQRRWSPCGFSSCTSRAVFTVLATRRSLLAGHVNSCWRGCLVLARPLRPHRRRALWRTCGLSSFVFFWRFVRRRVCPAQSLLGMPQLDSRKFGILETGEIISTLPAVCFFLFLSLSRKCNFHGSTHKTPFWPENMLFILWLPEM